MKKLVKSFLSAELAPTLHVAGLEEKGGGGYCFQKEWQDFARRSIKEVLRGPLAQACVPWPGGCPLAQGGSVPWPGGGGPGPGVPPGQASLRSVKETRRTKGS